MNTANNNNNVTSAACDENKNIQHKLQQGHNQSKIFYINWVIRKININVNLNC